MSLPETFAFANCTDCIASTSTIGFIAKQRVPYLLGMNPTQKQENNAIRHQNRRMRRNLKSIITGAPVQTMPFRKYTAQVLNSQLLAMTGTAVILDSDVKVSVSRNLS